MGFIKIERKIKKKKEKKVKINLQQKDKIHKEI